MNETHKSGDIAHNIVSGWSFMGTNDVYARERLENLIAEAIEAERERCARIAESYLVNGLYSDPHGISAEIAAEIRRP